MSRTAQPVGRAPWPEVLRWLIGVTAAVLKPLAGSVVCRLLATSAGAALVATGAWAVAQAGASVARSSGVAGGLAGSVSDAASAGSAGVLGSALPAVGLMVALSLIKAVLRYVEQLLGHRVAFSALELLRPTVVEALVPRAPRVMLTARSADLLARTTKDIDRIEVLYAHTVAPLVCALLVPALTVAAVGVWVSWPVAATAALGLLLTHVLVPVAGWRASVGAAREVAAARAGLIGSVTDAVQGRAELVGYGRVDAYLSRVGAGERRVLAAVSPVTRWAAVRRALGRAGAVATPLAVAVVGVMTAPAQGGGAGVTEAGEPLVPALAAAAAAVASLGASARSVEDLAASLSAAWAAVRRVHEVVTAEPELADGWRCLPVAPCHAVSWESVVYAYPRPGQAGAEQAQAASEVLSQVSVSVPAGTWTCLVGGSGSGKSTLVSLAVRADDPSSGRVLVGGHDVRELRRDSLLAHVAYVPQHPHLLRATIADNVRLAAPRASDEEVEAACRAAGVADDVAALPRGYLTMVGERGGTLSGGQAQRLALARALLARPAVLLLDEFTSHLDAATEARARQGVRDFLPQATVIEVTHRTESLDHADAVVVMDGGRVVEAGSGPA